MVLNSTSSIPLTPKNKKERDDVVRILYEEYISLEPVMEVWETPMTSRPALEPTFAAGFHGIELAFVLMAEFISDPRHYVVKRPRIELIADDITRQMELLAEIVDGELEDENPEHALNNTPQGSLTQDFPFPGAPPTTPTFNFNKARQSPALDMLADSIRSTLPNLSRHERYSLKKVIRNISGAFQTSFGDWTVGVGVEEQLSEIRELVGLSPLKSEFGKRFLAYKELVRPEVIMKTLTEKTYEHNEDFFFRSVHLGTECWAFVALRRLDTAKKQLSEFSHWHNAAAHILSASHILSYLGDHIMMLTSMILRDYLKLKVEIEGTSGEGSSAVKMLRSTVKELYVPFISTLFELDGGEAFGESNGVSLDDAEQQALLLNLYSKPEKQPGLYSYAKALEAIESGLNGGFYYKHFCLASNVIGTGAKGTMNKSVKALKTMYERALFPNLDVVRSELGKKIDAELLHKKGKIMDSITKKHNYMVSMSPHSSNESLFGESHSSPEALADQDKESKEVFHDAANDEDDVHGAMDLSANPPPGCPFHVPTAPPSGNAQSTPPPAAPKTRPGSPSFTPSHFEAVRRGLYSQINVPTVLAQAFSSEVGPHPPLPFLDHAWGKTPPDAHVAATKRQYALYQKGNAAWDVIFGDVLPESIEYIKWILGIGEGASVEFGHNSHELVSRLLSIKMERLLLGDDDGSPLRILTTDTEFYSFTRQMNRLIRSKSSKIVVETVEIHPISSFASRFQEKLEEGSSWDMVYVSQCVYSTQETIVLDLKSFVSDVQTGLAQKSNEDCFFVVDGYHGFGAIPTSLSTFTNTFYVSGMLKHVGSGANCAFLVVPEGRTGELQPLFTGWIADPSVLSPESMGIKIGSDVGYILGFALQGGTPAFAPSLLIFVEVMRRWKEKKITVDLAHNHVMGLHRVFVDGIRGIIKGGGGESCWNGMRDLADESIRSHTITFVVETPEVAKRVVELMADFGNVEVDSRKVYVRFGFGFNHNMEDVVLLLKVCEKVHAAVNVA